MSAYAFAHPRSNPIRFLALGVLLGLMTIALATAALAQGGRKVALVIGNSEYQNVARLINPANDASDIARTLEGLGFEVDLRLDLTQLDLLRAFQEFQRTASSAETAIVYYAGHGIEIDKRNYLIPISATLKTDRDVIFEAVPLDTALLSVEGASKVSLVIVDACRDNPFAATMVKTSASRSVGRGLAVVEPQGNTLVAYAAREGTTASDGSGRNSPYAAALIKVLNEPGIEIGKMFRLVRDQVLQSTNGQQEPFVYGSLSAEDIYINPPVAQPEPEPEPVVVAAAPPADAAPAPSRSQSTNRELDGIFWESVKDSNDPRDIEDYLLTFPDGIFKRLAQRRLAQLMERQQAAASPQVVQPQVVQPRPATPQPQSAPLVVAPSVPAAEPEPAPQIAGLPAEPATPQEPGNDRVVLIEPDQPGTGAAPSQSPLQVIVPNSDAAPLAPQPSVTAVAPPYEGTRDQIRTAQTKLNALGFDTGRPDGVIGRRTRGGVSEFQASIGMPDTGELNDAVWQRLNAALSDDRLAFYEEKIARERINRRLSNAALQGTYCHIGPDGQVADGLDGRPFVCQYVRPLTSRVLDISAWYGYLRNAKGNAMFPILTRAQGSGDTYTEDDGTEVIFSNGVMQVGDARFLRTAFN